MLGISAAPRTSPSPLPCGTDPNRSASWSIPDLLRRVLPGMVARGHGIDALSLYLGLARTVLLDLIVELDLPTPHDRPLRRPGGRNPWTFADTTLFIVLWVAGWHAESLGQRFGRSAGGAHYKARHLGLPRRSRKIIFRPPRPGDDLPGGILQELRPDPGPVERCPGQQGSAVRTAPSQADTPDAEEPAPWEQHYAASSNTYSDSYSTVISVPATDATIPAVILPFPVFQDVDLFGPTPVGTPPARKPKRQQIEWTRERDTELAQRWWARQHFKCIAHDMGISPSAMQSRRIRLGLPSFLDEGDLAFLRPDDLVDHFDPSVVAAHIAAADYVERQCKAYDRHGKEFWFWAPRTGNRTSKESERLEAKRRKRLAAPPQRERKPPSVPLPFALDPWDVAPAGPVPHASRLPAPFAPHAAMIGA